MKTLTLIDLSSIWWMSWHSTSDQEVGDAYKKTLEMVYRYVNGSDPVAICIDKPPYKRKEIDPEYKAQRDKPSALSVDQLRRVIERLELDGFPVLGVDGYEADDVIASIYSETYMHKNLEKLMVISSDKDLMQLIDQNTTQTSPMTGETYDTTGVFQKFGVKPNQLGNLLALTGDKSDNIPGVPGIGNKTAAKLLNDHGWENLTNLIDCDDPDNQIKPPGVRQKLLDNFDNLLKSRKLVELMTDVPVDIENIFKPRVRKEEPMSEDTGENWEPTPEETPNEPKLTEKPTKPKPMAIVKSDNWALRLEPRSPEEAFHLCKHLFNSRLYPQFINQESMLAILLRGRELGIGATTSLDGFHIVKGKPVMSGQMIVGLVLRSGLADYFKVTESTKDKATYKTHRKDDPDPDPTMLSFTMEDAKGLGLDNRDNWKKQPATMLRWRAATQLARVVYPDIVTGLYTGDEISNGEYTEAECEVVE